MPFHRGCCTDPTHGGSGGSSRLICSLSAGAERGAYLVKNNVIDSVSMLKL
ncbi:hypothetical protein [Streptomyces sp. NPDC029526]|uniref:hypothetical protein n=1 Tax=Streptomyces sp. NPDC029526 TaxID=3155728 RepID=UPI00340C123C